MQPTTVPGPPGLWQVERQFQHRFLLQQGLKPVHRLVDFGCGPLRGGIPLIRYLEPGHYIGVDNDSDVLRAAADRALAEGVAVPQLRRWNSKLTLPWSADVIWCYSVWIHLTEARLTETLAWIVRTVAPNGATYANVNIGPESEKPHRHGVIAWRPLNRYTQLAQDAGLSCEDLGTLADLGHSVGRPAFDAQRMLRLRRL